MQWEKLCSSKLLGGIGFQDLHQFNDALLGKQVWHLFHEKETLSYKVFNTKYFPSSDIFGVVLNPRCSFAWKSIKQVREMISNGARWRIEDGKDIWIWQHRWIPSSGSGKVLSPRLDYSLEVVQDLFILGTKNWDLSLLIEIFFSGRQIVLRAFLSVLISVLTY